MDKKSKKLIFIVVTVLIIVGLTIFIIFTLDKNKEKRTIISTAEYYLDNVLVFNTSNLNNILHFEPDTEYWKELIYKSMQEDPLISYKVLDCKELNQDIYKVTYKFNSKNNKDKIAENYVARINGEWKYIINSRDVPKNIYLFDKYDETILIE